MYCTNCGNELCEQAVVCPNCGVPTDNYKTFTKSNKTGLQTTIKVFLIIACVFSISALFIPLAWCLPMTMVYWKKIGSEERVSMGFKVCTLLFVNLIAGILMLCDE